MISNRCARKSLVTNCNSIISKNYLRFLVDSNDYGCKITKNKQGRKWNIYRIRCKILRKNKHLIEFTVRAFRHTAISFLGIICYTLGSTFELVEYHVSST